MGYNDEGIKALVGKNITKVQINEEYLVLHADDEQYVFDVEGDCCSQSYFWDFIGADKLTGNGPITAVEEVDLEEPTDEDSRRDDSVVAYGYRFISVSDQWGEQSSVVSFRNASNGYYGGWMNGPSEHWMTGDLPEMVTKGLVDISDKDGYVVQ